VTSLPADTATNYSKDINVHFLDIEVRGPVQKAGLQLIVGELEMKDIKFIINQWPVNDRMLACGR